MPLLNRLLRAGETKLVKRLARIAEHIETLEPEVHELDDAALRAKTAEFQLRYRVGFRVHDGKGNDYVPQSTLELTRDVTYSDADVLAKESEEQLLYRDMQGDMVQQIIRRLSAAHKPKA